MVNLDAVMRRMHGHGSATISVGSLVVDLSHNCAAIYEMRLELTAKEFWVIEFLAPQKGAALSKDAFLNHLYGGIDQPEPKIITVFTCDLRRKFIKNGAECPSFDKVCRKGYILCAIIRWLKKRTNRHPLFVKAVPAPSNSSIV